MYVNIKTRLITDLMGPKLRLLFEGGFYSSAASIQLRLLYKTLR